MSSYKKNDTELLSPLKFEEGLPMKFNLIQSEPDQIGIFNISKKFDSDLNSIGKGDDFGLPLRLSSLTSDTESYLIPGYGKDSKSGFRAELESMFGISLSSERNDIDLCLANYFVSGENFSERHQQPDAIGSWMKKPLISSENNSNSYDSTANNLLYDDYGNNNGLDKIIPYQKLGEFQICPNLESFIPQNSNKKHQDEEIKLSGNGNA